MHQNGLGRGRGNKHLSRPGPLLTDHLQVRDLDRELAILRRKREVVQREQQILTMECDIIDRKRQYGHTNRNMSNAYGNQVWESSPPKRALMQPSPWMSTSHNTLGPNMSESLPTNYIPSLMSKKFNPPAFSAPVKPIVHPMLKNTTQRLDRPTNVRKDFRPTSIIKRKPRVPPNKLNTYPVNERKNLVSKATESQMTKFKANKPSEDSDNFVLRENQTPNNQVNGRLELALGSVVKDIRSSHINNEKFKKLITNPKHQRTMKQAVRERIRTVMLNKTVGSVADIVKQYREKFSKASDKDIVEFVINSEHHNLENVIETENPEEFFKKNISSIFEKKIQDMAKNLLKMYERRRTKAAVDTNNKADDKESELDSETTLKIIRSLTGKYVTVEEKNALNKFYTELIGNILEEKLPEYLPKCADQLLKMFNLDHQFKNIKRMTAEKLRKEAKGNKTAEKDITEQDETNTETSEKEDKICENNETEQKEHADTIPNKEISSEESESNVTTEINAAPMDTEESASIPKSQQETSSTPLEKNTESPETIKSTTPVAIKTETSDTIKPETPLKSTASSESNKALTPLAKTIASTPKTANSPVTPSAKELPFYVKLIGRPKLPNRAVICDFLNNYKPTSIKKHKSINNLLVVGFVNQEGYDKILLANETVIDDITILIKASEKVNTGKENDSINEGNNSKIETQDDKNANKETKDEKADQEVKDENGISKETTDHGDEKSLEENKDIIGKEMNDQITDLLSSIKEGDENNENSKETTPLEPIKEGEDGAKTADTQEPEKVDKITKVKESGRATPVRSSSRLGNVTPSTIRTRRASRLMQE